MAYRKDYIPELDGLRALAVALVLWSHIPHSALPEWMVRTGASIYHHYLGVDLFFVLSGFLITRILLVDRESGVPLRHFLARRFLRIFPIYYLLIAVLAVVRWESAIPWASVYLGNYYIFQWARPDAYGLIDHTWSLCVEEHFYLLWPPVAALLAPRASRRVLWFVFLPLAVGTGAYYAWKMGAYEQREALYEATATASTARFGSLAAGALLAYSEVVFRGRPMRALLLVLVLAVPAYLTSRTGVLQTESWRLILWAGLEGDPMRVLPTLRLVSFPLISSCALVLLIGFTGSGAPHARLMRAAPLRFLGRISYGVYLYHYPLYYALGVRHPDHPEPTGARALLAVLVILAVAWVSWHLIERPLVRLADRFRGPGPRAS